MPDKEELFQVKEETKQNTQDIHELTRVVDRLAVLQEQSEKSRIEDRTLLRDLAQAMQSLDKQVTEALHVAGEVRQLKEDYRVMHHDMNTIKGVQTGLASKVEQLVKNDTKQDGDIKYLKEWRGKERDEKLKEDGGEELKNKVWKIVTTVAGCTAAVTTFVIWLCSEIGKMMHP